MCGHRLKLGIMAAVVQSILLIVLENILSGDRGYGAYFHVGNAKFQGVVKHRVYVESGDERFARELV